MLAFSKYEQKHQLCAIIRSFSHFNYVIIDYNIVLYCLIIDHQVLRKYNVIIVISRLNPNQMNFI